MKQSLAISIKIYLGLMAYLVLVKLILTFLPQVFRSPAQAAVFEWKFLAVWMALGLIGVFFADKTGFPAAWGEPIPARKRLVFPCVTGIVLGVVAIITELATDWTKIVASQMHLPSIHIDFPASALIYPGGAIIVEVFYRIFPVPLFLWLISGVFLRGRHQERVFWILAIFTALLEPVSQDLHAVIAGPARFAFACVFAEDYTLNIAQAWTFRRYGFLSAILLRVVFYLLWHVLWGLAGR